MGATDWAESTKHPRPDICAGEVGTEGLSMTSPPEDHGRSPKQTTWKKGQTEAAVLDHKDRRLEEGESGLFSEVRQGRSASSRDLAGEPISQAIRRHRTGALRRTGQPVQSLERMGCRAEGGQLGAL